MSDTPAAVPPPDDLMKLIMGDLSQLSTAQKVDLLYRLAVNNNLDPLSKPFDLLVLNNKLTIYANKSCADQIRKRDGITLEKLYHGPLRFGRDDKGQQLFNPGVWEVEYKLTNKEGRIEYSTGCIGIVNAVGDGLANAVMKADTKAKRRGTLSMGGLGFMDESEVPEGAAFVNQPTDIGEGRPRRVYPKPALPQALPPGEVVDAIQLTNLQEGGVQGTIDKDAPVVAKPEPAVAKVQAPPPAFSLPKAPLPAAKPPVKV